MKIAIAGAGNVGRSIARELIEYGHQVLLMDKNPDAIKEDSLPQAQWLLADVCEIAALDSAKLGECQVLITATGDDKANLVCSLLGKTEYGIPRVVARVNHPKNEWMFDRSWGIDVSVSTPRIISAIVEEAVTIGDVVRVFTFNSGNVNLVEITLPNDANVIGKSISEVSLPEKVILTAIVRDREVFSPTAHDIFAENDELIFLSPSEKENEIKTCFIK